MIPRLILVAVLFVASGAEALTGSEEAAQAAWTNAARRDLSAMCDLCRTLDPGLTCARWTDPGPLPPFRWSEAAADAARFHSKHLHDGPCFQHDSCCELERTEGGEVRCKAPACSDCDFPTRCPGTRTGDRYALLGYGAFSGENIAAGPRNALEATCGWLDSDGHRDNILSSHRELGVGLHAGASACIARYWTQGFGSPRAAQAAGYITAAGVMAGSAGAVFGASGSNVTAVAYVHDPDGEAPPQSVRVVVDGECRMLSPHVGEGGRALYALAFEASKGCHEAWFVAIDAAGARHTFPETGALSFGVDEADCAPSPVRTQAACEGDRACSEEGAFRPCYPGPEGTEGKGLCHGGRETCTQGAFGRCEGAEVPSLEICNGLDDDCDGEIDEEVADVGESCSTGRPGRCEAGETICAGGALACVALHQPTEEICNGIDDDCDGSVDDGLGQLSCGVGGCLQIIDACLDGVEQACPPVEATSEEVCGNNLDDDCDGSADEGCPCSGGSRQCYVGPQGTLGKGQCAAGLQTCDDGVWSDCDGSRLPSIEQCNGKDDDCDGAVDEGLGRASCGEGACVVSTAACAAGVERVCQPNPERVELCNGVDDDCDGEIDEGCHCVPGTQIECYSGRWETVHVGACRSGLRICQDDGSGFGGCQSEVLPVDEVCGNAVDDDCDGLVDEDCVEPPDDALPTGCDCGTGGVGALALLALLGRRRRDGH